MIPLAHDSSPWPHRVACLLVCATFPLIFVGGLVTTTEAGMAVPDWPTTFGYNMLLYPWQSWLAGPWNLFVEHGHRLLGALVGGLSIVLLATLWLCDRRRWLWECGLLALGMVIVQGSLGGLRVTQNSPAFALAHGCFGPLFFAACVALAVFTSRWWRNAGSGVQSTNPAKLLGLSVMMAVFAYVQLVLGALIRHADVSLAPGAFQIRVALHVFLAAVLLLQGAMLAGHAWRHHRRQMVLIRPAAGLALLLALQAALGGGTWVLKYGWPVWFRQWSWAQQHLTITESMSQVLVTTAHVALGSLIVAQSFMLSLRAARLRALEMAASPVVSPLAGAGA